MASFKKIFITLIAIISFLSYFTAAGLVPRSEKCGCALKKFCESLEKGKIECMCSEFEALLSDEKCCDPFQTEKVKEILEILETLPVCDKEESVTDYEDIASQLQGTCDECKAHEH
ncbi:11945_t:CDS:2 [Dentiscutata erythropus]|uniref:11945_t:CDS:1 n=1 Tax=Dentiscutata erythropus TaxID=1348616 RepID=A0A9N9D9Y0_9GLOM|nr:11945_t:CDS:2 [Dentiscutata erythropus]